MIIIISVIDYGTDLFIYLWYSDDGTHNDHINRFSSDYDCYHINLDVNFMLFHAPLSQTQNADNVL